MLNSAWGPILGLLVWWVRVQPSKFVLHKQLQNRAAQNTNSCILLAQMDRAARTANGLGSAGADAGLEGMAGGGGGASEWWGQGPG